MFPNVPPEIQAVVNIGVAFLVVEALKAISILLGKDLSGWATVVSAAVVLGVLTGFDALIVAVPELAPYVQFIAMFLSLLGFARVVKSFRPVGKK